MAGFIVDNNVESTVADSPLAQSAVTLNVANGEGANFPATFPYRLTIWDETAYQDSTDDAGMEIVECTARTADALTIVRAKEGTADVAHANGERVALLITAGLFNDPTHGVITKLNGIEAGADVTDATNVNAAGAVMESDFANRSVITCNSAGAPANTVLGQNTIIGRQTAAVGALSPSQVRGIISVEENADVTDATNVAAAGAVMRTSENITISGGAVTPTGTHHVRLETQDGAGTDNLDHVFLTNYNVGDLITFSDQNSTHDVTVRDNTVGGGAIYTEANASFTMAGVLHTILFVVIDLAGTKSLVELGRFNG